jgi:hypothetical protein
MHLKVPSSIFQCLDISGKDTNYEGCVGGCNNVQFGKTVTNCKKKIFAHIYKAED